MRSTRILMLCVLVGVLVLGLFGCKEVSERMGKVLRSKKGEVVVTPVKLWTDTGMDLKAGQTVQITAKGEVFINESMASSPSGLVDASIAPIKKLFLNRFNVTSNAQHGALIGRVGDGGEPFFVGTVTSFKTDSKGRLYLGINDKDYHNNQGAYEAKIVLK